MISLAPSVYDMLISFTITKRNILRHTITNKLYCTMLVVFSTTPLYVSSFLVSCSLIFNQELEVFLDSDQSTVVSARFFVWFPHYGLTLYSALRSPKRVRSRVILLILTIPTISGSLNTALSSAFVLLRSYLISSFFLSGP